jgi:multiple sugar transport system permease protein
MNIRQRQTVWGYALLSPWLIGFLVLTAGPMITSLWLSFTKYDFATSEFVGVENYRRLFVDDPLFWKALKVTLVYAVFSVPLGIAGSLALAMLLNTKVLGMPIFRTIFYLPSLVPAVAAAVLWQWIFNADNGLLNQVLGVFGFAGPQWLQDENWTIPAFLIMSLWGIGGGRMIIFLAGLQSIPDSYVEAANLDGASPWQTFRHITLPLLSPVMFFNLILGTIGSFQYFTQAYVMTSGGPNNASLFYALYLFRNAFEYFKIGKASALAWVLFVILLAITLIQLKLSKRWVHYEGEKA